MAEILVNDWSGQLAADLPLAAGAGDTLTVTPAAPASAVGGRARARIGTEIVTVTITSGNTWTIIAREAEDADRYPKMLWSAGTAVDLVLTAGGFAALATATLPTDVAYLDQPQTFTQSQTFAAGATAYGGLDAPDGITASAGEISTGIGFVGNGSQITNLNASAIASGTLSDTRLSANVPLLTAGKLSTGVLPADVAYLDQVQTFTQSQTFNAGLTVGTIHPTSSAGVHVRNAADTSDTFSVDDSGNVTITGTHIYTGVSLAIGNGATVLGNQALAAGLNANASGDNSVAIGPYASATQYGNVAIGLLTSATGTGSVAVGSQTSATFAASFAACNGLNLADNEFVYGCINGLGAVANMRLTGYSSTQQRSMFYLTTSWVDSTDATRKVRAAFTLNDAANPVVGREIFQIETDGTQPMMGFFGSAAVSKPSLTYSRTGETTAAAQMRTALAALGLVADNTTP